MLLGNYARSSNTKIFECLGVNWKKKVPRLRKEWGELRYNHENMEVRNPHSNHWDTTRMREFDAEAQYIIDKDPSKWIRSRSKAKSAKVCKEAISARALAGLHHVQQGKQEDPQFWPPPPQHLHYVTQHSPASGLPRPQPPALRVERRAQLRQINKCRATAGGAHVKDHHFSQSKAGRPKREGMQNVLTPQVRLAASAGTKWNLQPFVF